MNEVQERAKNRAITINAKLILLRKKALNESVLKVRGTVEEMAELQEQLNGLYFVQIFGGVNNGK